MVDGATQVRVLIVDKDEEFSKQFRAVLQQAGYEAHAAPDAYNALNLLDSLLFDVVITDIELNGSMTGIELLAQIKLSQPDICVIIYTLQRNFDHAVRCLRLKADDYFVKPTPPQLLLERVADCATMAHYQRFYRQMTPVAVMEPYEFPRPITLMDGFSMDSSDGSLLVGQTRISLTRTEFRLLFYLAMNAQRTVSCRELIREARGLVVTEDKARRLVRPHIANIHKQLRKRGIRQRLIVNVHSEGYRFNAQ